MPRGIPNKPKTTTQRRTPSGVKSDTTIMTEILVMAKELKKLTDMLDKRGYEVSVDSQSITINLAA